MLTGRIAMSNMRRAQWLLLSLSLLLPLAGDGRPALAQGGAVTLNLVSWSYGVEIVRDNIGKLQQRYPGLTINYSDFSWATYHDAMVARFVSKTPTDVLYASDHWLQEWAAAGWIVPVDEPFPQVRQYLAEYSPFVREALTYKGRIYGTPYYADTFIFVYNTDHLQRAGVTPPPATLEELTKQAEQIKSKRLVDFPIVLAWDTQASFSIASFTGLVFAQKNGVLFGKDLNPTFKAAGSAAEKVVVWATEALGPRKILSPTSLQAANNDQIKALQAGSA